MSLLEALGSLRLIIHRYLISLITLAILVSLVSSLTPPRIIYGGWIPILPGHPFYFGSVRHKSYEQHAVQSQPHYPDHPHAYYSHSSSLSGHPEYHSNHEGVTHPQGGGYEPINHNEQIQHNAGFKEESGNRQRPMTDLKYPNDIYSYFPHQSTYDEPQHHVKVDIKPIYIEVPRKPMDLYENPRNYVPYILPQHSKDFPKELKVINHGGEKAFLKITPIESISHNDPQQVGPISFDKLHFVTKNMHNPSTDTLMKPYRYGYQNEENSLYSSPQQTQGNFQVVKQPQHVHDKEYDTSYRPMNTFRGTNFPVENTNSDHKDSGYVFTNVFPSNKYLSSQNYIPYPDNSYVSSFPSHASENLVSVYKAPVSEKDNFQSSSNGNSIQVAPNSPQNNYNSIDSYHLLNARKPLLTLGGYKYNSLTKNAAILAKALKNTLMPKMLGNYFHKNVKVGAMYREPDVLTHFQGTPAVLEREVAIVHVPVQKQSEYLDAIKNYREVDSLHETASTPQYTDMKSFMKLKENKTRGPLYDSQPTHLRNHTYGRNNFDHSSSGRPKYNSDYESYEKNLNRPRHYDSIFVGTDSINANDVQNLAQMYANNNIQFESTHFPKNVKEEKQFFHAYYAPSDHIPPQGYKKMSIKEFEKLFKNAEIQYLRREQTDNLKRAGQESSKVKK